MPQAKTSARIALVTGTSSGIGMAIAQCLLDEGWTVRGLDLVPPEIVHARFVPIQVDLADGEAVSSAARAARAALKQTPSPGPDTTQVNIDAFVHAAGVMRVAVLGALDAQGGETMWRLHVDAATRLADALLPAMAARGFGRVVLIGSRVAHGLAGRSQYAATKAALIALARSWAAEVVAHGVTVNVVSPAATQTAMLRDPSRAAATPKLPPLGRLIQPDEIARLVAYLLGPAAAAITGQDIQICGGASLPR